MCHSHIHTCSHAVAVTIIGSLDTSKSNLFRHYTCSLVGQPRSSSLICQQRQDNDWITGTLKYIFWYMKSNKRNNHCVLRSVFSVSSTCIAFVSFVTLNFKYHCEDDWIGVASRAVRRGAHSASSSEQQLNFYRRCVLNMCSWSASLFFISKEPTSRPTAHAQYTSSVET